MKYCLQCPRHCEEKNFCQAPEEFKINTFQLHFGEEPYISGNQGSGTIFFSHCNLQCVFCQNYPISQEGRGQIYSDDDFIKICEQLKEQGAHNLNLVSPTCYTFKLIPLLKKLKKQNFDLPIIWNSNGYEEAAVIKKLEGLVDIYLPDFKYSDDKLAIKYSNAPHYFEISQKAIWEMYRQKSNYLWDGKILKSGLLIRHLILPNNLQNSLGVLKWIRENFGPNVYLGLMSQYFPTYQASDFPEINRNLNKKEYQPVLDYALDLGFENVLVQQLSSATDELVPEWK